jgi:hypothetical protein
MAPAWVSDSVLAFVRERRGEQLTHRTVVSVGPSGRETQLTDNDLAIMVFAVSGDGELLAAIATTPDGSGDQRMILVPVGGGATVEVPKVTEREQQQTPAFRR